MASTFIRTNSEIWSNKTEGQKNEYKDSIVFIEDVKQIWSNGVYYNADNGAIEDMQQQIDDLYLYIDELKGSGNNIIGRVSFEDSAINGSITDEKLFGENVYLIEQEAYTQSPFVSYTFNEQLKGGLPYVLSFYSKAEEIGGSIKAMITSLDGEPFFNQIISLCVDEWGQSYGQIWIDEDLDGFILRLAFVEASNIYISCLKLQAGNTPTEGFEAISEDIDNLQKQIDGEKTAWFLKGQPTLTNSPASNWTTEELRQRHDGDTYTDVTTFIDNTTTPTAGQSWRWCNVDDEYGTGWHWHKIADSDAVKALAEAGKAKLAANSAQQTANAARNTSSAINTDKKIYLIGAENQSSNQTTYSHSSVYVNEDGKLYNNDKRVLTTDDIYKKQNESNVSGTVIIAPNCFQLLEINGNVQIEFSDEEQYVEEDEMAIYHWQIKNNYSQAFTIALPSSLKWSNGQITSIPANTCVEFSILEGMCIWYSFLI